MRPSTPVVLGVAVVLVAPDARGIRCPAGMVSIAGGYCIDVYEASLDVVSESGATLRRHSPFHTVGKDERVAARSRRGVLPQAYVSRNQAAEACENAGKRLCSDDEWLKACRGKSPTRYPYGDSREPGRCNDNGVSPLRKIHGRDDSVAVFGMEPMNDPRLNQVPGSLAAAGAHRRCRSSYGTYDMVGNLHEWTAAPSGTFRGGYYLDVQINGEGCEYRTTAHAVTYHDYSTGFRCCVGPRDHKLGGSSRAQQADGTKPKDQSSPPQPSKSQVHVVEPGDTLSGIARRYSVTVAALCAANGVRRDQVIRIGQPLKIPSPKR